MRGKLFALILISSLILLPSCGNTSEDAKNSHSEGDVATKGVKEYFTDESKNIFDSSAYAFGYNMEEYHNPRGEMTLNIPNTWEVKWNTDRQIEIRTSETDEILPNTNIYLFYNFNRDEIQTPREIIDVFKDELFRNDYMIKGSTYNAVRVKKKELTADNTFTKTKDKLVTRSVMNNILVRSSSSGPMTSDYSRVDYYINWYNSPCVFSCLVPEGDVKKAIQVLQTLSSNIIYCGQNIAKAIETKPLEEGFNKSYTLPYQFKEHAKGEDFLRSNEFIVYKSQENDQSKFSGMSVSIYALPGQLGASINGDTIADLYGVEILKQCFTNASVLSPAFHVSEEKGCEINDTECMLQDVDYSIIMDSIPKDSYLIPGDTWKMRVYKVSKNNAENCELIIVNYQDGQSEAANEIFKMIED